MKKHPYTANGHVMVTACYDLAKRDLFVPIGHSLTLREKCAARLWRKAPLRHWLARR